MKTDYAAHDQKYRALRQKGEADGWDSPRELVEHIAELEWAIRDLLPFTGKRVLELGCGAGNVSVWLEEMGFEVTGVDISPTAIEWANERKAAGGHARAKFLVGDVLTLAGLEDGSFDAVIDGHCLHCIIGEDRARVLASARRVLVEGGLLHVATMCGPVAAAQLVETFDPASRCQVVEGVARRFIGDPEEILAEIRAAGFRVLRSRVQPRAGADEQDMLWANAVRE